MVGGLFLILVTGPLAAIALAFGPWEYFSLFVLAMAMVALTAAGVAAWIRHQARVNAGSIMTYWEDPDTRVIFSWAVVVAGPVAVAIWVMARRELMMRSVLNHLVKAKCPYCLFSLAGLRIEMGAVTCPECSHRFTAGLAGGRLGES